MDVIIFKAAINSDIQNIKPIVSDVLSMLPKYIAHITEQDNLDLKLILSEALSNAMIHGNHNDKFKRVLINTEVLNNETVLFQIVDEGQGFNYEKALHDAKVQDLYNEDGRGFLLIESLCDTIKFLKNGKEIHIYKTVVHNNV